VAEQSFPLLTVALHPIPRNIANTLTELGAQTAPGAVAGVGAQQLTSSSVEGGGVSLRQSPLA